MVYCRTFEDESLSENFSAEMEFCKIDSCGRCYDFPQFSGKNGVSLKNQCCDQNLPLFLVKNGNFFANFFGQNLKKSVPALLYFVFQDRKKLRPNSPVRAQQLQGRDRTVSLKKKKNLNP
jgi:hypothetical protein